VQQAGDRRDRHGAGLGQGGDAGAEGAEEAVGASGEGDRVVASLEAGVGERVGLQEELQAREETPLVGVPGATCTFTLDASLDLDGATDRALELALSLRTLKTGAIALDLGVDVFLRQGDSVRAASGRSDIRLTSPARPGETRGTKARGFGRRVDMHDSAG
jgi:hypothetical protein